MVMLVFLEENNNYYRPLPDICIIPPLRVIQTMTPMPIGEQAGGVNLSPLYLKGGAPGLCFTLSMYLPSEAGDAVQITRG